MPLSAGESGRLPLPDAQRASPTGHKHDRVASSFPSAFSSFAFPKKDTKTPAAPPTSLSSPRRTHGDMQLTTSEAMALPGGGNVDNRSTRGSTSNNTICSIVGGESLPTANSNAIASKFGDLPCSLQSCRAGNSGSSSPSVYSSIIKEKRSRVTFTNFYKTKLCPWYLKGNCHWGATCNYAHTLSEQREAVDLTKTKLCSTWLRHGACHNQKCRFAHDYSELRATTDVFKTALCSFYIRKIPCPMEASCRFAHGVHELRPRGGPLPDVSRNDAISTLEEIPRNFTSQRHEQQHKDFFQQCLQQQEEHHQHVSRKPYLQHHQQSLQQQQQQQQQHLSGVMAAEARLAAAAAAAAGAAARAAAAAKAATEAKAAAAAAAAAAGMTSTYGAFPYGLEKYKMLQESQAPPPGFSPISHTSQGRRAGAPSPHLHNSAYEKPHRALEGKTELKAAILEHTEDAKGDGGCLHQPHATGILTLDKTTGTWRPAVPAPAYRPLASGNGAAVKKGTAQIISEDLRQPCNTQGTETPGYPVDGLESTFDALLQALHQQQRQQQHQRPKEFSEKRPNVPATTPAGRTEDVGKALTMVDFTKLLSTVAMAIAAAPVSSSERQQQHQQVTKGLGREDTCSPNGKRKSEEDVAAQKYTTEPPTATTTSDDSNAGGAGEPSWIFSNTAYGTVEGQSGASAATCISSTPLTTVVLGGRSATIGESSAAGSALQTAGERAPGAAKELVSTANTKDGEKITDANAGDNVILGDVPPWLPVATPYSFSATTGVLPFETVSSPSKRPVLATRTPSAADKTTCAQKASSFLSQTGTPLQEKTEKEDIRDKASPLQSIEDDTMKYSSSPGSTFLLQDRQNVNCASPTAKSTSLHHFPFQSCMNSSFTAADRLDAAGTLLIGGASPAGGGTGAAGTGIEDYMSPAASERSAHGNKTKADEAEKKCDSQKSTCWRRLFRGEGSQGEGTSGGDGYGYTKDEEERNYIF